MMPVPTFTLPAIHCLLRFQSSTGLSRQPMVAQRTLSLRSTQPAHHQCQLHCEQRSAIEHVGARWSVGNRDDYGGIHEWFQFSRATSMFSFTGSDQRADVQFQHPSVTPPANGTTTATLNVATTAASAMLTHPANGRSSGVFYALILPVFGLTLVGAGIGSSGPRRRKFLGIVIIGMVLMCLMLLPSCGGSSGGGGGGGGTPAGAYTITVTGSNGGAMVTGTPALTLTIN